MRWRPVAILGGTPHASTEDDTFTYNGVDYFIPAGSTVYVTLSSQFSCPFARVSNYFCYYFIFLVLPIYGRSI